MYQENDTVKINHISYTIKSTVVYGAGRENHIKRGIHGQYLMVRDNGRVVFSKSFGQSGAFTNTLNPLSTGIKAKDMK